MSPVAQKWTKTGSSEWSTSAAKWVSFRELTFRLAVTNSARGEGLANGDAFHTLAHRLAKAGVVTVEQRPFDG